MFAGTSAEDASRSNIIGKKVALTTAVTIVGIAFVAVSSPGLFDWIAGLPEKGVWANWTSWISRTSHSVSNEFRDLDGTYKLTWWLWRACLIVVPLALVAPLVQWARSGSSAPVRGAWIAFVMGILGVPIISWICEIGVVAFRVGRQIALWLQAASHWLMEFVRTHQGVFVGILVAVAAVGVMYGCYRFIEWARENFDDFTDILKFGLAVAGTAGVVLLLTRFEFMKVIGRFFVRVYGWLESAFSVIGRFFSMITGYLLVVGLWVAVACVVVGLTIAIFGTLGRTMFMGLRSSLRVARSQNDLLDSFFGMGFAISLLLSVALVNSILGYYLHLGWQQSPVMGHVPQVFGLFDFLVPSAAEDVLLQVFKGSVTTAIDLAIVDACAVFATIGLVFFVHTWDDEWGWRLAKPVLLIGGLAIAGIIPVLIIAGIMWFSQPENWTG